MVYIGLVRVNIRLDRLAQNGYILRVEEICQDREKCNAKPPMRCAFCGEPFIQQRSSAKFCTAAHRVYFFRAAKREARIRYQSEHRSAISLGFDGRVSGKPRRVGKNCIS
jgi:hypothetical protein